MDSLQGTSWDVLIAGTGLQESLLALALSRTGKTVLHVDKNPYYGSSEAALSLQEAEQWCEAVNESSKEAVTGIFSEARIFTQDSGSDDHGQKLSFSRAYSLALAPQLIYTRSPLLPALVATGVESQVEFLAVGSWWTYLPSVLDGSSTTPTRQSSLLRIPNGREDVVADTSLDLKQKRSLMKFLRFITNYENQPQLWEAYSSQPLATFLSEQFKLSPAAQAPIVAIAFSPSGAGSTTTEFSLPRVARHLKSIGLFGPGFGAVTPKWGGLAEIAQVGCRSGAVGGGVYVLGNGVKAIVATEHNAVNAVENSVKEEQKRALSAELVSGDLVTVDWIVGAQDNIPLGFISPAAAPAPSSIVYRCISVVSSALDHFFPQPAEGAAQPAAAVVVFPSGTVDTMERGEDSSPVQMIVHSSSTGECPDGQCIVYTSIADAGEDGFKLLNEALNLLLAQTADPSPHVLWKLQYKQICPELDFGEESAVKRSALHDHVLMFPPLSPDLALGDSILDPVKEAWLNITSLGPEEFMVFGISPNNGGEVEE